MNLNEPLTTDEILSAHALLNAVRRGDQEAVDALLCENQEDFISGLCGLASALIEDIATHNRESADELFERLHSSAITYCLHDGGAS